MAQMEAQASDVQIPMIPMTAGYQAAKQEKGKGKGHGKGHGKPYKGGKDPHFPVFLRL